MPRWNDGGTVLLDTAAFAIPVIVRRGTTSAMAGAVVLAAALADRPDRIEGAFAVYETRLRPWAETAQRVVRRSVRLTTPAHLFQSLSRDGGVLRVAAGPFPAP